MDQFQLDQWHMDRALGLAVRGQGAVEPNPMVGCIVARGAELIAEGYHRYFGGPHAEVEALQMAGPRAKGATLYVTLEPCCHWGKTPPCTEAIIAAGIRRVVLACVDPFPEVAGQGINQLRSAGIEVVVGVREREARKLLAPYLKWVTLGRPWILAKWAMTLDGKLATIKRSSRWISSSQSREIVHRLRGRVDAILIGRQSAEYDDPLLLAEPPGPRTAVRVVLASRGELSLESRLVQSVHKAPVWVAVSEEARDEQLRRLEQAGCVVLCCAGQSFHERLSWLLNELGRRQFTNVLVEGGARVFGTFFDLQEVDEVHVFVAPKLFGGESALSPIAGVGVHHPVEAFMLEAPEIRIIGEDVYIQGHIRYKGERTFGPGLGRRTTS